MIKRDDILQILRQYKSELEQRFGISRLALFGSVARDQATDRSDLDLLIEFNRPIGFFHLARTQQYLENILHINKIDLVTPDGIRPAIKEQILREAIDA